MSSPVNINKESTSFFSFWRKNKTEIDNSHREEEIFEMDDEEKVPEMKEQVLTEDKVTNNDSVSDSESESEYQEDHVEFGYPYLNIQYYNQYKPHMQSLCNEVKEAIQLGFKDMRRDVEYALENEFVKTSLTAATAMYFNIFGELCAMTLTYLVLEKIHKMENRIHERNEKMREETDSEDDAEADDEEEEDEQQEKECI